MFSSSSGVPVILVGAHSAAARAIGARLMGVRPVIGVVRSHPSPGQVQIDDYRSIPTDLPWRGATIVNCVGTTAGNDAAMQRINVDVPMSWAVAGADAGASLFIQLSSFSVFGLAQQIDGDTPLAPTSGYGRSKVAAERALFSIRRDDFRVSVVRVPMLFARDHPGKLAKLVKLIIIARLLPMPKGDVRRSMLSYDDLARVVEALLAEDRTELIMAADPLPFQYALLEQVAAEAGISLYRLPVPQSINRMIRWVAPALGERLFSSNMLEATVNFLSLDPAPSALRAAIALMCDGKGSPKHG